MKTSLLSLQQVTKMYGTFAAIDTISFSVEPGEVIGLLGPNGAGKTTTLRMCTGLLRPTTGAISIAGLHFSQNAQQIKQLIGYVPDEPYLYDLLTAREFVTLMGKLYGMREDLPAQVASLLERFDLGDAADTRIGSYSHGMKQKTALCGALIHAPRLLFLDEPTVGLDPRSAKLLKTVIRELADQGQAVLLSTHILEIAQTLCDRVVILDRGKVRAQGSFEQLRVMTHADTKESLEDIFLRLTDQEAQNDIAYRRS